MPHEDEPIADARDKIIRMGDSPLPPGYSDTPTPLPPVPRSLPERNGALLFKRIASLLMLAIIAQILYAATLSQLNVFLGKTYRGVVTDTYIRDSKGGGSCYVRFSISVDGVTHIGEDHVEKSAYDYYTENRGCEVPVRFFAIGPIETFRLATTPPDDLLPMWMFVPLCVLAFFIPLAVGAVGVYFLWIAPARLRAIYIHGIAVRGSVVSKALAAINQGRVTHTHTDPISGQTITATSAVRMDVYDSVEEGLEVTVLFYPGNPKRTVVYELGFWEFLRPPPPRGH
jgi:hypothetical protein